jgi:hypothetical protein
MKLYVIKVPRQFAVALILDKYLALDVVIWTWCFNFVIKKL